MGYVANPVYGTGLAALLFAAIFLVGGRLHPLRSWVTDRRSLISFGAGLAAAYVFIHLLPELHAARQTFAESFEAAGRLKGMGIYFLALVGFMLFYGLDHWRAKVRDVGKQEPAGLSFRIHVGGYAVYVWMMSYLLVNSLEKTETSTLLYAVAVGCHLLTIDHALREEHGAEYERLGRWALAGMALAGWGIGQLVALPPYALALLVAFVSGAVIMNSSLMELPSEKDGRFVPFLAGGLIYGLILLPFG